MQLLPTHCPLHFLHHPSYSRHDNCGEGEGEREREREKKGEGEGEGEREMLLYNTRNTIPQP